MEHHEPFIAAVINRYIVGPIAGLFGIHSEHSLVPAHIVMVVLVAIGLIVFSLWLRRRLSVDEPSSPQLAVELVISGIQSLMRDLIGENSQRYFPLLGALFIYILFCNLLSQIPGFVAPTSNINVPVPMAVIVFLYYNYHGFRVHGPKNYMAHFAGPVLFIAPLIFCIEIVSHAFRMFSLSVRLFGNLFAEELVSGSLANMFPFLTTLPTIALGLFASLIQAFVFILLTMVYIGEAVAEEGH